ncbi:MAG: hypothetical protein R3F62_25925 [Planctomycetota bacterium]
MFSLLIPAAVSLAISLSLLFIPKDPFYLVGPFLGLVTFVLGFTLIRRKVSDKVMPLFERAAKQAQAGNIPKAIESLEEARPYRNWQLFLAPQIDTQIGSLHYAAGHEKEAIAPLRNGYPKSSEPHLLLGAILSRQGDREGACEALRKGILFNKKSPILYNVLAFILERAGKREEAITALSDGLKAMKSDAETSENLERLQSGRKLNMTPFGQLWYMLKFEAPPGGVPGGQPVRKGFRQPPKAGGTKSNKDKKRDKKKKNRR